MAMYSGEVMYKFEGLIELGLARRAAYALAAKIFAGDDAEVDDVPDDLGMYIKMACTGRSSIPGDCCEPDKTSYAALGMILEEVPAGTDLDFLDDPDELMRLAHVGERAVHEADQRRLERKCPSIWLQNKQVNIAYEEGLRKALGDHLAYVQSLEASGTTLNTEQRGIVQRLGGWWVKGQYDWMCVEELREIVEAVGAPPFDAEE